jgi:hypothetical protein
MMGIIRQWMISSRNSEGRTRLLAARLLATRLPARTRGRPANQLKQVCKRESHLAPGGGERNRYGSGRVDVLFRQKEIGRVRRVEDLEALKLTF